MVTLGYTRENSKIVNITDNGLTAVDVKIGEPMEIKQGQSVLRVEFVNASTSAASSKSVRVIGVAKDTKRQQEWNIASSDAIIKIDEYESIKIIARPSN